MHNCFDMELDNLYIIKKSCDYLDIPTFCVRIFMKMLRDKYGSSQKVAKKATSPLKDRYMYVLYMRYYTLYNQTYKNIVTFK